MSTPGLPSELLDLIARHWGFRSLRPLQEQALRAALSNRDSLVVLPTGGGKSLCYQAPAVFRGGLTVVVSPLIALMKDQVDGLTEIGVPAVRLDSTLTSADLSAAFEEIRRGTVRLAFTSPERLVNTETYRFLRDAGAHTVAIDEAHCISHWGHDFRPEYRQLARLREVFPDAAVHAYTATATEQVRRDIVAQLGLHDPEILIGNFDRPNLTYRVLPQVDLVGQIREVLDRHKNEAGIVYCLRRKDVDMVCPLLQGQGYKAVPYHAGMTPEARRVSQEKFASEEADVVVATVAFGMGIDRSNVRFVCHASIPKSLEHYQQETGRAGRDGLPSECVLLYSGGDIMSWKWLIRKSAEEGRASPEYVAAAMKHLGDIANYASGAVCRHRALVRYFGQDYPNDNCGACDLCLSDTQSMPDATIVAQKILSCVARVKESFGINHVVEVLRGANLEAIRSRGHDQLSTYGLLRTASKTELRDWVHQLISQNVLALTEGEYPVLRLTPGSWEVMRGERQVRLIQLRQGERGERRTSAAAPGALPEGTDPELFETLRQVRRQEAARMGVPPYQVFPDTVLAEFARGRPSTLEAMRFISGVGDYKLKAFGELFLAAIRDHCRRTGLPQDVRGQQMTAGRKEPTGRLSPKKEQSFRVFRDGGLIEDAMRETGLARTTAVDHLCEFIRLEKPASIFGWVRQDVCERVAAAAEEHGTARLKPMFLALNEEVPYDDIRIVFAFLEARRT